MLVPLENNQPVLGETVNSLLRIENIVEFPNENIKVNNLMDTEFNENQCEYHPTKHRYCPVFKLGDIISYLNNQDVNYSEMAKFGAYIMITIEWNCFKPLASKFECKPEYSFRKIDSWQYNHRF